MANAQQTQDNERAEKLRTLLVERRDTLKKRLEFVQAMYKHGTADVRQLLDARNEFLEAGLDLASTRDERAELYQKRIEFLREIETISRERHKNGTESIEQVLLTTAARLQAAIDMLREQASDAKHDREPDAQSEAPAAAPRAPDAADGGSEQEAKTYPVWAGEWERAEELNRLLGYEGDDLDTDQYPASFRLSLSKTIGHGVEVGLLQGVREVFRSIEHQIVATGKWETEFDDAPGFSVESKMETSCFVTEHAGSTFLWVPAPWSVVYGGKISFLEGSDRSHDAIVIDFNTMPKHLAGVVRASDTVAYKRRAEKR